MSVGRGAKFPFSTRCGALKFRPIRLENDEPRISWIMGQASSEHNTYGGVGGYIPLSIPPRIARMPASVRAWKEMERIQVEVAEATIRDADARKDKEFASDQRVNQPGLQHKDGRKCPEKPGNDESEGLHKRNEETDTVSKKSSFLDRRTDKEIHTTLASFTSRDNIIKKQESTASEPTEKTVDRETSRDLSSFDGPWVREEFNPSAKLEVDPISRRRIHILGVGQTGKFVAHALASLSERPQISLLIDREDVKQRWNDEGQLIEVLHKKSSDVQAGFDIEPLLPTWHSKSPIEMLIVTTKPSQTVPLLLMLKPRLGPTSTICFLQNSMGIMDDVDSMVFPDRLKRPRYISGTTSHLLIPSARTFTTEQKKPGEMRLSLVPRLRYGHKEHGFIPHKETTDSFRKKMFYEWTTSSRKLMRNLTRSTHLNASGLQYRDLLEAQLQRLTISAILEPLCVMFDCPYGDLLSNFAVTQLMAGLLSETTSVVRALPEFAECEVLHIEKYFSPRRIEYLVFQYAAASKLHIPNMLVNLRKGQRSEIEWVNGYFLRRAEELGIACPFNQSVFQMVKAKETMMHRKLDNYVSWEGD